MDFFNLTLSGKHFMCPSILNDSFAGQSNLGCRSLLFITLNTSHQFLLACKFSFEKSADSLVGTPLQVTICFSLTASKLFIFDFWHFNYDVCWCGPFWVHLVWGSLCFLNLHVYFHHQIRETYFIIFSNNFSVYCYVSSPSCTSIIQMLVCLQLSQRFLSLSSFFWILFSS